MKVIAKTPFRYKGKRIAEGTELDVTDEFLKQNGHVCEKPINLKRAAEEEAKKKEAEAKAKAEEEAKKGGN